MTNVLECNFKWRRRVGNVNVKSVKLRRRASVKVKSVIHMSWIEVAPASAQVMSAYRTCLTQFRLTTTLPQSSTGCLMLLLGFGTTVEPAVHVVNIYFPLVP